MTNKTIEEILNESKVSKWPYPKTFTALKNACVEYYSVNFDNQFQAIYRGEFGSWQEKEPCGYQPMSPANYFSPQGIKNAIIKHAQQRTPYIEFLREIADCGVSHYVVDMKQRTVSYYNRDESQSHIEQVPSWNAFE